jgi:hypothetical protein
MVRLPLENSMRGISRRRSVSPQRSRAAADNHRITFHFRAFAEESHGSRFPQMRATLVLAVFAILATLDVACATPRAAERLSGNWGGTEAAMTIDDRIATIHFPCASARIEQPIMLDANGSFDVPATFKRLHGVQRIDRDAAEEKPQAVRFTGRITGDELALTLHFPDSNAENEQFTMTRGEPARVPDCA